MITSILPNETKVNELLVNNDVITLTDKRLIYNANFIGINELRSATVTSEKFTEKSMNLENGDAVKFWCSAIIFVIVFIFMYQLMHPSTVAEFIMPIFFALIAAMVFGTLAALPLYFALRGVNSVTAKTTDVASLRILKTDGSSWIQMSYSIERLNDLELFCNEINSKIYR